MGNSPSTLSDVQPANREQIKKPKASRKNENPIFGLLCMLCEENLKVDLTIILWASAGVSGQVGISVPDVLARIIHEIDGISLDL